MCCSQVQLMGFGVADIEALRFLVCSEHNSSHRPTRCRGMTHTCLPCLYDQRAYACWCSTPKEHACTVPPTCCHCFCSGVYASFACLVTMGTYESTTVLAQSLLKAKMVSGSLQVKRTGHRHRGKVGWFTVSLARVHVLTHIESGSSKAGINERI